MSDAYEATLVERESTLVQRAAWGVVGVGFLSFLLAWTTLFRWTTLTMDVGVELITLYGLMMLFMGVTVAGIGVASYLDVFETNPARSPGIVVGVVFALLGFVTAGLFASQTLGFGAVLWVPIALLVGVGIGAATVFMPEDLGSTLPVGAFLVLLSALFLAGIVGADWSWHPPDLSATFTPVVAAPALLMVGGLLGAWSGAKATAGFGARGRQNGAFALVALNAFAMLSVLVILLAFVFTKGIGPVLNGASLLPFHWPFVTNVSAGIYVDVKGVWPAIVGTVWLVLGSVVFAVPLAVGAAVFLTEYAEDSAFTRGVEIATNGLWSTPSIVFGLFGLAFLVPRFGGQKSILAGQLVLGFMLLPLVLITSQEAIKGVPDEYRDASAALGVSQWETIKSVVLPAAMPGIITGIILGIGRIAGETAPILLVTAGSTFPNEAPSVLGNFDVWFTLAPPFVHVTNDALLTSASALPYQLYATITAGVGSGDALELGWGTALVLLGVVLSFYAVGIVTRIYFRRKLEQ